MRWKQRGLVIVVIFALALGGGGFWFWEANNTLAKERAARQAAIAATTSQIATAREAADAPELAPEVQRERLEKLVALQRRLSTLQEDSQPAEIEELHRTESRLEKLQATVLQQRSEEFQKTAEAKLAAGETEAAVAALREAVKLQREVNAGSSEATRNIDRELRLTREVARLVAEPLQALVRQRTEEARAAVKAGRWDVAAAAFQEAKATQERLNQEFPRSIYSDLPSIARFDAELASLTADGIDGQVSASLERARTLAQQGNRDEAVKEFLAAAAAQRDLNERFSRSRFVSMERLEQIETERQTLLAAEPWAAARQQEQDALRHLRHRQIFNAQQCVRTGLELLEDVASRLPKAKGQDDTLRTQLAFLNVRSNELAALQDRIYDQLAPLPGEPRALLKTEVLQAEFARLLNTNPSRNAGRALPADSVNYGEAEEFCRRLSWIMGWRVRLPNVDDMRAAMSAGSEFQNITTGLDEWLAPNENSSATAPVWSGEGTITTTSRNERARTRGFRVVVEVDLARLGETP